MKNPKVQFVAVTLLFITAGLLLIPSLTQAKPKGIPTWQADEPQRDGYSRSFVVDANSILLEVPAERCFVLLKLYAKVVDSEPPHVWESYDWYPSYWNLTIDGEMFLDELSIKTLITASWGHSDDVKEEFPDRCVVVRGSQALGITKLQEIEKVHITLIGYFCDMP